MMAPEMRAWRQIKQHLEPAAVDIFDALLVEACDRNADQALSALIRDAIALSTAISTRRLSSAMRGTE